MTLLEFMDVRQSPLLRDRVTAVLALIAANATTGKSQLVSAEAVSWAKSIAEQPNLATEGILWRVAAIMYEQELTEKDLDDSALVKLVNDIAAQKS